MKWISVKDKLPEKEGLYMVYLTKSYIKPGKIYVGDPPFHEKFALYMYYTEKKGIGHIVPSWDAYSWAGDISKYITHWMPLPEPPTA